MTRPISVRWCKAPVGEPHPAEGRSGYCAFHYAEYKRAMSAFRSARHSSQKGVGKDPGDRAEFERSIAFTPLHEAWTAIGSERRAEIRAQIVKEAAAIAFLPDFAMNEEAFYNTPEPEFRRLVAELLRVHTETMRLLRDLGEEPRP